MTQTGKILVFVALLIGNIYFIFIYPKIIKQKKNIETLLYFIFSIFYGTIIYFA